MKIEVSTHPGVIMVDPIVELRTTLDNPINETFTPSIVFIDGDRVNISHELPPQPYVKGTWEDVDVQNAIDNYLKEITVK